MIYHVYTSTKAEREMRAIADYISFDLDSPQAAYNLMDEIQEQIDSLEHMPKKFAFVSDKQLAQMGVRSVPVKNYSIFYVVDDSATTVSVISVMYGKRDWANLILSYRK